jgi:energy-coupling factor transporter transmembrane protein EcfT
MASVLGFGAALGLAFLTRPVLAPAVAVLALYYVIGSVRSAREATPARTPWRELLLGLAPAVALFALFLYTNWSRFGAPLETGYGGVVTSDWVLKPSGVGLLGATVSPGSGLLWFAPALLLLVPWLVHELRRGERRLPWLVLAMLAAIGIPHVLIPSWHGAWSYGPRYMLPLIPFLWFPLGVAFGLLWERVLGRVLVIALLVLGGVTALGGVVVEYTTNIDLSTQAARLEWPSLPELENESDLEEERFVRTKFDWRFAAPWAHWRLFRHRMAGLGESIGVRELYYLERDERLEPTWTPRGFRHFAWVDLTQRLGAPWWLGPLLCAALLLASLALLVRAREADTV